MGRYIVSIKAKNSWISLMVDEADIELRVIIQYTTQPQYLFHSFVSVFVTLVFLLVSLLNNFSFVISFPFFCFLYFLFLI